MITEIDVVKCTGCEICVDRCPMDVLRMDEKSQKAVIRYPEDCTSCFECELRCPCEAIYVHPLKGVLPSIKNRGVKHG